MVKVVVKSGLSRDHFSISNLSNLIRIHGYTDIKVNRNFPFPKVNPLHEVQSITRIDANGKNGKVVLFIFVMDDDKIKITAVGGKSRLTMSDNIDQLIKFLGDNK